MNISNLLSILRIVLAIPIAYFIYIDNILMAIIIGIIAGLSDFFDGFLARKLNQITELGKILDPVADKFLVAIIAFVMIFNELLPLWFFLAVLIRDILILLAGSFLAKKYNLILPSNFEGKVTFLLIIITILGVLLKFDFVHIYGYYLCTAALIYSFISYLLRFIKILKENY